MCVLTTWRRELSLSLVIDSHPSATKFTLFCNIHCFCTNFYYTEFFFFFFYWITIDPVARKMLLAAMCSKYFFFYGKMTNCPLRQRIFIMISLLFHRWFHSDDKIRWTIIWCNRFECSEKKILWKMHKRKFLNAELQQFCIKFPWNVFHFEKCVSLQLLPGNLFSNASFF